LAKASLVGVIGMDHELTIGVAGYIPLIEHLKRRQDFLAAAKALVCARKTCVVQARVRDDDEAARIGFTVTRKLGNAVIRNRIKRRLREAVRVASGLDLKRGHDYVFIGRAATLVQDFPVLTGDIVSAINRLNEGKGDPPRTYRAKRPPKGKNRQTRTRQDRQA
jgi:ribonuclease P protein component